MASAVKICTLLLLAAQAQLMLAGTAAASSSSSDGGGGCIRRVDKVSNKYGSCQCYRKCAHPEEGWLTNAASQQCFVDCVLRQGCVCPGYGDGDDGVPLNVRKVVDPPAPPPTAPPPAPAPTPPPPPPPKVVVDPPTPATPKVVNPPPPKSKPPAAATTTTIVERYHCDGLFCVADPVPGGFPVRMDGTTLRVTVPRPKVSRSRIQKDQEEEMLVVDVSFVPSESDDILCMFIVQVYSQSQREVREDKLSASEVPLDVVFPMGSYQDAHNGRKVEKIPIGDRLEKMGADGDKTIVVLLFQPRKIIEKADDFADIYKKHKLTIRDVRVEYERKAS